MPWTPCPHNPKKLCADCKKQRLAESKRRSDARRREADPNKKKVTAAAYYQQNKQRIVERSAEWAANNKDKVRAAKQKYQKHGARLRKGMLFAAGQTVDSMIIEQDNCCALCGEVFSEAPGRGAVVDHCHQTGVVRALLHRQCNSGIGFLKDSVLLCIQGAEYLLRHTQTITENLHV